MGNIKESWFTIEEIYKEGAFTISDINLLIINLHWSEDVYIVKKETLYYKFFKVQSCFYEK